MNTTVNGGIAVGAPGSMERLKHDLADIARCRDNACALANRLLQDLKDAERAIEQIQEDSASGVSWIHVNTVCNTARNICGRWRERENPTVRNLRTVDCVVPPNEKGQPQPPTATVADTKNV